MSHFLALSRFVLICLALVSGPPAHAGQTCEDKPLAVEETRKAFGLALNVRQALEQSTAQVVLLGRVGQDLSKHGLRYSHLAFVWRDHPEGNWLGVHLLNECGTSTSTLYNQGLANFFADDLFAWDALLLIPSDAVQERLVQQLKGPAVNLHHPAYNMVAYPFSVRYQNSNQWVLEVLARALAGSELDKREAAQAWLLNNEYRPSTLPIPTLTRLGGRMFKASVAFDDHPMERRMAGQIDTVTVESVASFLARRDPASTKQVIRF